MPNMDDNVQTGSISLDQMQEKLTSQEEVIRKTMADTAAGESGGAASGSTIRVTPEMLRKDAYDLGTQADEVRRTTESITSMVMKLNGQTWSGAAQSAYMAKFRALQDEISPRVELLKKHAGKLQVIASTYNRTESEAKRDAADLPTDIFGGQE